MSLPPPSGAGPAHWVPQATTGSASSSSAAQWLGPEPQSEGGTPRAGWSQEESGFWIATHKADRAVAAQPTQALSDIVKICTAAHRVGKGNFLWLCWQPCNAGQRPDKGRAQKIKSGLMAAALTRQAAETLLAACRGSTLRAGHFDVALRDWMEHQPEAATLGCSYLWPPLGSYTTHASACDPTYRETGRPGCWGETWCCQGTRRSQDAQRRDKWLTEFVAQGPAGFLCKVDTENDAVEGKGRKKGKPGPTAMAPPPTQRDVIQPLPRPDVVAVIAASGAPQEPTTKRQARERRLAVGMYARRIFVSSANEERHLILLANAESACAEPSAAQLG